MLPQKHYNLLIGLQSRDILAFFADPKSGDWQRLNPGILESQK